MNGKVICRRVIVSYDSFYCMLQVNWGWSRDRRAQDGVYFRESEECWCDMKAGDIACLPDGKLWLLDWRI